jgi:cytochrome c2
MARGNWRGDLKPKSAHRLLVTLLLLLVAFPGLVRAESFDTDSMLQFIATHPQPLQGRAETITSNVQDLDVWWIDLPDSEASGGAITSLGDILFVVQPTGEVLWMHLKALHGPYSTVISAPMNRDAFLKSPMLAVPDFSPHYFRAAGALVEGTSNGVRLFVSHHVFESECIYLQVSAIDLVFDAKAGFRPSSDWKRIFRPEPCIHVGDATSNPFAGHQAGGKIVSLDNDHLLVAYGDHEVDGISGIDAPQSRTSPYGKIWKIARDGSSTEPYALGFRNQQGLLIDSVGRVWATEHGAQGGDELNLVVKNGNYGWPSQTYGVWYGDKKWPLNERQGRHLAGDYISPKFAWVPSIAPTNIIQLTGKKFALWDGDLLLATLKGQSLHRLRVDGDHVAYDERIPVGNRIRDITTMRDGRFLLMGEAPPAIGIVDDPGPKLLEYAGSPLEATSEIASGQMIFERVCAVCHDSEGKAAPSLRNIDGRPIGKQANFEYSAELSEADGVWEFEKFARFAAEPATVFPETTMPPSKISREQADLVYRYLDRPEALDENTTQNDSLSAPFRQAFAVAEPHRVVAFEPILPDLRVGFRPDSGADVRIGQQERNGDGNAETGAKYVVDVEVADIGTSTFVTYQTRLGQLDPGWYLMVVTLRGHLNTPDYIRWELSIPNASGTGDRRVHLGRVKLGTQTSTVQYRAYIDFNPYSADLKVERPHLFLFLPTQNGSRLVVEDYSVEFRDISTR